MKTILIIDIETSNFLDKGGKILEIGIVELNLEFGERNIIWDKMCHERPITKEEVENAWIIENSDMTVEEVQNSEELKDQKEEIQELINRYEYGATAFNNKFDFGFMENSGFTFPKKLDCPMLLSTDIVKLPGKFGNYKWPSVEEAYKFFFPDSNYVELHRGADDALHESEIVLELFKRGIFKVEGIELEDCKL